MNSRYRALLGQLLAFVDPAIPLWIIIELSFKRYGSRLFPNEIEEATQDVDQLINSVTDENSDVEIEARSYYRRARIASAMLNLSLVSLLSMLLSTLFLLYLNTSLPIQSFLFRVATMIALAFVVGFAYTQYCNFLFDAQMTLVSDNE